MKFLKEIFIGAIKGILSVFIAFIILMLFFSLISALFSPSTNEEIVVKENTVLFIDDLNIIGDRDTKPEDLNFNFEFQF